MPFVPVPQTMMVELRMTKEAQRVENTLYFQGSAAVSVALAESLATALQTWWNNNLRPLSSADLSLNEIFVTDLTSQESFTHSHPISPPITGSALGESLPSNVALCITFRTDFRGRSGRGRNYLCGVTESNSNASFLNNAYVNSAVGAYNLLLGAGTFVPGLQWVVVTRFFNKLPRPVGLARPVRSAISINNAADSQRRRLPGRGR